MISLEELYRDDHVLALVKPSGLSVHRGLDRSEDTVVDRLRAQGIDAHPVHRLDRATSGVLLCARSKPAAVVLSAAFREGGVSKKYLTIVRGHAPERELVDHPIPVDEGGERAPARTQLRRLELVEIASSPLREKRYSLVEAEPLTGRFHQLRRHLKHLSHPVIGDTTYGKSEHNHFCATSFGLCRLALHAFSLTLQARDGLGPLHIVCPLPNELRAAAERMGFSRGLPSTRLT